MRWIGKLSVEVWVQWECTTNDAVEPRARLSAHNCFFSFFLLVEIEEMITAIGAWQDCLVLVLKRENMQSVL
jgi:hypothetical protein